MAVHQARLEGEKLSWAWVGASRMLLSGECMGKNTYLRTALEVSRSY